LDGVGVRLLSPIAATVVFALAQNVSSIYTPLLEERYHGALGSSFTIVETTIPMPPMLSAQTEWERRFPGAPDELRRAMTSQKPAKARKLDASQFPSGTLFVPAQAMRSSAFSNKGAWLAFSDALITGDGLHALVYYRAECGGLCGEEGYAWLRRTTGDAAWTLAKKVPTRFS